VGKKERVNAVQDLSTLGETLSYIRARGIVVVNRPTYSEELEAE